MEWFIRPRARKYIKVTNSSRRYVTPDGSLVFSPFRQNDDRLYKCEAKNSIASAYKVVIPEIGGKYDARALMVREGCSEIPFGIIVQSSAWCSEVGYLTSLHAPELHHSASSDVREPISLHQAVYYMALHFTISLTQPRPTSTSFLDFYEISLEGTYIVKPEILRGFDHSLGKSAHYGRERVAIVERMLQKAKQTPRLSNQCHKWFHGLVPIFRQLRIRRRM